MNWLLLLVAALFLWSPQEALAQDNTACLACHQAGGTKVTFPGGGELDATVDPGRFEASVHGSFTCNTCHAQHQDYPHPPRTANTARAYSVQAQQICAACHGNQAGEFDAGVHGQGVRMGLADPPLCTSCHTSHAVIKPKSAEFRNNTPEVCGDCHADEGVMRRYGLRPVYQAYLEEFHGVTTRLYRIVTPFSPSPAAVCYDCHAAHRVLRVADPLSPVSRGNILAACRTCHTTAGRFFATAWNEHRPPSLRHSALVYLVQVFYLMLIPSVVGVLALLTALDLWHWAVTRWGGRGS